MHSGRLPRCDMAAWHALTPAGAVEAVCMDDQAWQQLVPVPTTSWPANLHEQGEPASTEGLAGCLMQGGSKAQGPAHQKL